MVVAVPLFLVLAASPLALRLAVPITGNPVNLSIALLLTMLLFVSPGNSLLLLLVVLFVGSPGNLSVASLFTGNPDNLSVALLLAERLWFHCSCTVTLVGIPCALGGPQLLTSLALLALPGFTVILLAFPALTVGPSGPACTSGAPLGPSVS